MAYVVFVLLQYSLVDYGTFADQKISSSPLAQLASTAATTTARSSLTAMQLTRTAAMATMLLRTVDMRRSMVARLWRLSTSCWHECGRGGRSLRERNGKQRLSSVKKVKLVFAGKFEFGLGEIS